MDPTLAKRIALAVWDDWYMAEHVSGSEEDDRAALETVIQGILDGEIDTE